MKRTDIVLPASYFGIILGLVGLGNGWRIATRLWGAPPQVGEALMAVAALVWAGFVVLYATKWRTAPDLARAEITHPIQGGYVALLPLTTMLVAMALIPYSHPAAWVFCAVGVVGQLAFGLQNTGRLWQGGRSSADATTVMYLPTVGVNFVAAAVVGRLGHVEWGALFFGAGVFAWLALESVLLQRHLTEPLPPAVRPTLGIQLAPPVVGAMAYLGITADPPDVFVYALLGYGLYQLLMLLRMAPWFMALGFVPGFWGFTFGVTAIGSVALQLLERAPEGPGRYLALPLFAFANLFVGVLMVGTLRLAWQGKLFPHAPPAA